MKLMHTSDWHLGKSLEGHSRLPEQEIFIDEFIEIVKEEDPDLILIAGDIFDSYNPPAAAEQLYYDCLKKLSETGRRLIVVIAGNHDSPERLAAPGAFLRDQGVLVFAYPKQRLEPGPAGSFEILKSGEGFVQMAFGEHVVNLTAVPFPSERRLNELFHSGDSEEAMRTSYSDKVESLLEAGKPYAAEGDWNLAMGHFFSLGGATTDSERPIQIGGGYSVSGDALPDFMDYLALGHLHRPQRIRPNVVYAGSPMQYSKSEINYSKAVFAVDLERGEAARVREIFLTHKKPLEVWQAKSVEEALKKLEENRQRAAWVYLNIETDHVIPMEDIRAMKTIRPDLLAITPVLNGESPLEAFEGPVTEGRDLTELFAEFYEMRNGAEPQADLMELLKEILEDEEKETGDETDQA